MIRACAVARNNRPSVLWGWLMFVQVNSDRESDEHWGITVDSKSTLRSNFVMQTKKWMPCAAGWSYELQKWTSDGLWEILVYLWQIIPKKGGVRIAWAILWTLHISGIDGDKHSKLSIQNYCSTVWLAPKNSNKRAGPGAGDPFSDSWKPLLILEQFGIQEASKFRK